LTTFLASSSGPKEVYAPATGEALRIGEHVQSYSFALGDSIASGLSAKWSKVSLPQYVYVMLITDNSQFEGYEVTMVDGKIAFQMGSTVPTLERPNLVMPRKEEEAEVKPEADTSSTTIEVDEKPIIPSETETATDTNEGTTEPAIAEATMSEQPEAALETQAETEEEIAPPKAKRIRTRASRRALPLPSSLFIGDLRLTVLKSRLQALNPPMPAEFAGSGVLICGPGVLALANQGEKGNVVKAGSIVAVRKGDKGVEIEGSVGSVYDLVKKEVYGSFAQVSA
jgi:cleavage and polyadenylation specificity factor subunit 2